MLEFMEGCRFRGDQGYTYIMYIKFGKPRLLIILNRISLLTKKHSYENVLLNIIFMDLVIYKENLKI